MPAELPAPVGAIKNKLNTPSAWLWLLDITITGVSETLRFVNNPENITYNGNIYTRCNFTLGTWESKSPGELPSRTINISNIDLVNYLLPYVRNYNGIVGATAVITPVNSFHLNIDMSSKAQEFTITQSSPAQEYIIFVLGTPNPLIQRFPSDRYIALHCSRFVSRFKGVECGYSGGETVCDGTLKRCTELINQAQFGGFPGLRSKTIRFA